MPLIYTDTNCSWIETHLANPMWN